MIRIPAWLRVVVVCLCLSAGLGPAIAANVTNADDVTLNFVNADIDAVIRAMSKITRRNFVVDPRVKGTLNIVANTPVSPALAYQMLLSALRLQGYAVVEGRNVTEVMPEADAKLHSVPVTMADSRLSGERLVTRVFTIKHESAAQLVPVVRPLVAPNNTVTAYPGNNTLVVTDYADNLQRIARIIEAIDVPQSDVVVIPIRHASAIDLANTLNRVLGGGASSDPSRYVAVIADERVNALLVRSENASRIAMVRELVASLDQTGIAGNVHVVYLRNAEANALAQTLRGVLSGASVEGVAPLPSLAAPVNASGSGAPAPTASRQARAASSGTPTGGATVQADPVTNALIITAPEAIYNNLRQVIDTLDRRRAQVYVEALIAELTADRAAEFGIQWQSANNPLTGSGSTAFGGTNFGTGPGVGNILDVAQNPLSVTPGLNLLIGKGTITLPGGQQILNLTALAHFLQTQVNTNILSTPNLVMLDNEEAKIVVGQNVPFITGQMFNTGGGTTPVNPFQTITRQDVGLTLRIKPQISEGGAVRLQIYEESSSVVASTATNASGPITNKRSIETTALVNDGAIIALGGLVQDSYSSGEDKVPLLGDVPILGALFRHDTRQRTKTNLVVFLRPKILRDAESYRSMTSDRYDFVIGQQRSLDEIRRPLGAEEPGPRLPPQSQPGAEKPQADTPQTP